MPNPPEAPAPVDTPAESRLGRAGELAAFLRDNHRETRRDPEELAKQFNLDPAVVAQIQASARVRGPKTKTQRKHYDLVGATRHAADLFGRLIAKCVAKPRLYQSVVAVLTLALTFLPRVGGSAATLFWIAAQVLCLAVTPQFRLVILSSALLFPVSWIGFIREFMKQATPEPWNNTSGIVILGFIIALTMVMLNSFAGSGFVVVAGSLQIAARRRREASLSRQDLLSRMFFLQEQLESLPAKIQKPSRAILSLARRRLFLTAFLVMLVPSVLTGLAVLAFHVDPEHVRQTTSNFSASNSNIKISSLNVSSGFLFVTVLLSVLRTAGMILCALIATSWRKVGQTWLGVALGAVSANMITWPTGGMGSAPVWTAVAATFSTSISSGIMILIVRFVVGFNRSLQRYRAGDRPDEASIVSELLEIRQRLSANPVQVCVLVVDAAGSTQMKRLADPLKVEFSFGRYQHWLGEMVAQNGGKVEIRTGDGAICAFGEAEKALAAANALQDGVDDFNATQNRLELPFRLRIALHSGAIVADLDKVQFTEVIDVAAHVEKYSPVGGIALTAPFVGALTDLQGLSSAATVDGVEVFTLAAS